jgi:hypothetical protein
MRIAIGSDHGGFELGMNVAAGSATSQKALLQRCCRS